MIEEPLLTTENCRYCLMCRHVCPVAHVTRSETYTPHGWGLTIASIKRGLLDLDIESVNVIYSCADCGTCRANCVTDQPLPTAIAAMRAEIVTSSLEPRSVKEIARKLDEWSNPFGPIENKTPLDGGDVALYIGDNAHFLAPEIIEAVNRLLRSVGIEPVLIGVGRNNGYLASSLGYPDLAARFFRETLDELASTGASSMLVLTAGDYYAFHQMHNERYGQSMPADVALQEVIPYLSQCLSAGQLAFGHLNNGSPYAYVDPTHSVRVKERFDAPRHLLDSVMTSPRMELFWRKERTHPSGDGALLYTQPHLARHLAYSRLDDVMKSGAREIICEDPGTLNHLADYANKFGLKATNLYELLAEQLVD